MLTRIPILALSLLFLATTAFGQVTLSHKINEGETYKTKITIKTDQKLLLGTMNRNNAQTVTVEQKSTVGKRGEDGKLTLTWETAMLTADIKLPEGMKVKFDAANPDANAAEGEVAKQILSQIRDNPKNSVKLVFDKKNELESPAEAKEPLAQQLAAIPTKSIKKGDTWEQQIKMPLEGGQLFTFKRKYTYEGETSKSTVDSTRKVHKITAVDSDIVYSLTIPMAKVSKSDLKVADSKFSILFDPEAGRAIETSSLLRITGKFTISSMGVDEEGDLDLTLSNLAEEIK